jgi:hypothetical protein
MSARLPEHRSIDAIALEAQCVAENIRLLACLEFERDPPLTEQEWWHEELGRISPKRKQVCSTVGALELTGTRFARPRLELCADDSARRLLGVSR